MVMWFGFDWPSKAAVVVVMTFFPMLVNTVAGLAASGAHGARPDAHLCGASYWQTLIKLRLPAALPFIFNALKINSTLALIGAIVAEFFGTPIVGMGFRISTEVGRMNIDMVWATIAVAALAGSVFYGLVALARARAYVLAPVLSRDRRAEFRWRPYEDMKIAVIAGVVAASGSSAGASAQARRQGDAAAEMGDAGAVRRLLRRQGQGLLQGRRSRRHDQAGRPGRRARRR